MVIPDSPDSDTEKLISANDADDLTQDGLDSELLPEDTPAMESPSATTATTTILTSTTTKTTTKPAAVVVNGGFVGDDVPLTDAEMSCDDSLPAAATSTATDPRQLSVVAAAASSEASEPVHVSSPSPPPVPRHPPPPSVSSLPPPEASSSQTIVNGCRQVTPVNGVEAAIANDVSHSSQVHRSPSPPRVNGDVTKDALLDIVKSEAKIVEDSVNGEKVELEKKCEVITTSSDQMTTATKTVIENGIKTENIEVTIVENGISTPSVAKVTSSTVAIASNGVDHNLNEQNQTRDSGRKDGHYFLEKTNNEENRIQV